jgi:hypothetical protein
MGRSILSHIVPRLAAAAVVLLIAAPAWATPVTLNAVDRPGGTVLHEPVDWQVRGLDKQGKPIPTPVAVGTNAVLKTDLKPGHYMLTAKSGTISITQGLVVGSGNEVRNIVVSSANAVVQANPQAAKAASPAAPATGTPAIATVKQIVTAGAVAQQMPSGPSAKLTIGMIPNSGRGFISEPIDWQVFTYSKGVTENGQLVARKSISSATFTLPAGSYVVRAGYKGTQSDLVIPLQPGQSYNYTINLYAGQAKLSAMKPTGVAREPVEWKVVREKPGADGKYQLVATSNDNSPQLLLREGNYLVMGRIGDMWGVQPLAIKAGRTTTTKVTLKRGEGAPIIVAAN